jgi:N-acetylmuramoyl-L-alanine amidase
MKRILSIFLILVCTASLFSFTTVAAGSVSVSIDGTRFTGGTAVQDFTTYVAVRRFSTTMDANARVTYNSQKKTMTVTSNKLSMTVTAGQSYIVANGRYLYTAAPAYLSGGVLYAPVVSLARAFGASISWSDATSSFAVTRGSGGILSGDRFYREDNVYWLARIINAESRGEPLLGQIAVGNVVLNRVKSRDYPNTIWGVIFDRRGGVQFSPVLNGTVYNEPYYTSVIAAKLCLEGVTVSEKILFFYRPEHSTSFWIPENRPYAFQIGHHYFFY